jgi:hypothetical protein
MHNILYIVMLMLRVLPLSRPMLVYGFQKELYTSDGFQKKYILLMSLLLSRGQYINPSDVGAHLIWYTVFLDS